MIKQDRIVRNSYERGDYKSMVKQSDILIVGAGTASSYLSWLMTKRGYSVTIIERDLKGKVGQRLEVIHFETDRLKNSGLPLPKKGTPELIGVHDTDTVVSPDYKSHIKVRALQSIIRLPLFLERLHGILESEGVKIEYKCKFIELVYQNKKIVGLVAEKNGEKVEFRSRLIVDASGTVAAVRTSLPPEYGVETFKLGPNDVMHVLLQYIKWSKPDEPHPPILHGYIYYQAWLGPSGLKEGAILGIGQGGSYENAKKALEDLLKTANFPPYEILKSEQGITPYRRPPYSLVSDAFLCIGDAAAITYPFSGHGVTATWNLCKIAADVIEKALKQDDYISRDLLWEINVNYFKDQGAKFAALFTQLSGILNFSEKEWNYILKKELIYKTGDDEDEDDIPEPNKEFEEEMTIGEVLKFISSMLLGIIKRKLSLKHVLRLISSNGLAGKIRKHYENFPENPNDFDSWTEKTKELWNKKKVALKKYPSVTIEYR